MKKYMILALFVFCQSHAMEQVCHLNKLPVDVLNLIASFLTCDDETEKEFIERTQYNEQQLDPYADEKILQTYHDDGSDDPATWFYVQCFENDSHKHTLDIIERDKNGDLNFYDGALEPEEYHCVALFGTRMALFYFKKIENTAKCVLEIQRFDLKKNEKCNPKDVQKGTIILGEKRELFPLTIQPRWIGFNKQGTHLIAHGIQAGTGKITYQIFPLKTVYPTTNKLQEYFRDKLVCNQCIEGKK